MKKILAIALALMLAIPALAFADGNDADIVAQGAADVTAAPDMVTVTANAGCFGQDRRRGAGGHEHDRSIRGHPKAARIWAWRTKDIVTTSYTYYHDI